MLTLNIKALHCNRFCQHVDTKCCICNRYCPHVNPNRCNCNRYCQQVNTYRCNCNRYVQHVNTKRCNCQIYCQHVNTKRETATVIVNALTLLFLQLHLLLSTRLHKVLVNATVTLPTPSHKALKLHVYCQHVTQSVECARVLSTRYTKRWSCTCIVNTLPR